MATKYTEWADKKVLIDLRNRFANCYQNEDGSIFYVEPQFYTAYLGFKMRWPEHAEEFLKKMDEEAKKNHKVVFVGQEDNPLVEADDAVFLTALDIANLIHVIIDDKSDSNSEYKD